MLTLYATLQVKLYTHEALNRVKRFFLGTFFVVVSFVFWLIGFILLFLALFFYFAGKPDFVLPGVWTALISMGVGLVITIAGVWIMKKKSHQSANIPEDGAKKHNGKEFGETFTSETEKLIGFIAGIIVSCIKRSTDQSGNISDVHSDDKPNGTAQK